MKYAAGVIQKNAMAYRLEWRTFADGRCPMALDARSTAKPWGKENSSHIINARPLFKHE